LTRWLILFAISVLIGTVAFTFGDGPVLDEPLTAEPVKKSPAPDGDVATKVQPRTEPLTVQPVARPTAPAAGSSDPAPKTPTPETAPRPDPIAAARAKAEAELRPWLADLLDEFNANGKVSRESIAELADHLAAHPEIARPAIAMLFDGMPSGLFRARPFLFKALLDTEDETVRAEIRRRIEEKKKAILDSLPRTREEVHDALLFGEAKNSARVVRGLKREFLNDPFVLDYLRTTAQSPSTELRLKRAAITALGRTRTAASAKFLVDLFTSSGDDRVRAATLRALGGSVRVDPSVAQTMLDQLHDRDQTEAIRRFAVSGLAGAPKSPEVKDALLEVLRSEHDIHMRRAAVRGIGKYVGDPGMKDMLRTLRDLERDEEVVAAIDRLLERGR